MSGNNEKGLRMLARVDHTEYLAGVVRAATSQFAIVDLACGGAVIDQDTKGRDAFEYRDGELRPGAQIRCHIAPPQPGDAYRHIKSFF